MTQLMKMFVHKSINRTANSAKSDGRASILWTNTKPVLLYPNLTADVKGRGILHGFDQAYTPIAS